MQNIVLFSLTQRTSGGFLKGGNVSFELAGEHWLTLMQEQRWWEGGWGVRGVGGWEKRTRLERKAERERCAVKTQRERGSEGARVQQWRRGIRRKKNAKKKNIWEDVQKWWGEHERRAAGVGLNISSARFPTAERWINRSTRECVHDSIRLPHLLPRPPFSNQQQLVNAPAPESSQRHSESLGELGEYTKSLAGWGGSWQTGSRLKGRLLEDHLSRLWKPVRWFKKQSTEFSGDRVSVFLRKLGVWSLNDCLYLHSKWRKSSSEIERQELKKT